MQIKVVLRYQFIPSRMAIIKKTGKCWGRCGESGLIHTAGGNVKPLWKIIWQFLKKSNIQLKYDPAIQRLNRWEPKSIRSLVREYAQQLSLYGQTLEATRIPICRWMAKQTVVWPHNGILLRNAWTMSTLKNRDEFQNKYIELKKPDEKDYTVGHHIKSLRMQINLQSPRNGDRPKRWERNVSKLWGMINIICALSDGGDGFTGVNTCPNWLIYVL